MRSFLTHLPVNIVAASEKNVIKIFLFFFLAFSLHLSVAYVFFICVQIRNGLVGICALMAFCYGYGVIKLTVLEKVIPAEWIATFRNNPTRRVECNRDNQYLLIKYSTTHLDEWSIYLRGMGAQESFYTFVYEFVCGMEWFDTFQVNCSFSLGYLWTQ